jgi:hypothetical protein
MTDDTADGEAAAPAAAPTADAAAPADAAPALPKLAAPFTSHLQWLHQTYVGKWKGTVDIQTLAAEDHRPKHSHWITTINTRGA